MEGQISYNPLRRCAKEVSQPDSQFPKLTSADCHKQLQHGFTERLWGRSHRLNSAGLPAALGTKLPSVRPIDSGETQYHIPTIQPWRETIGGDVRGGKTKPLIETMSVLACRQQYLIDARRGAGQRQSSLCQMSSQLLGMTCLIDHSPSPICPFLHCIGNQPSAGDYRTFVFKHQIESVSAVDTLQEITIRCVLPLQTKMVHCYRIAPNRRKRRRAHTAG